MKRFATMAAVLALLLGCLAGCGQAPQSDSFRFGGIGPLTGKNAIYGESVRHGMEIAVAEINEAGGINGTPVTLSFADDAGDAESSVNAYNKLMDDGMQLLLGTVTTDPALSVGALAYKDRTFMLTPSASSPDVTAGRDNVFQVCFSDLNQGSGAANYISAHMPDCSIAIIYRNDDSYSQGVRDNFVATGREVGLKVVYEGTFTADTDTDFSVQLTAARAAGADLVFLPIYYTPASVILTQADRDGYHPTFFGVDGMDGILGLAGFDPQLAEGLMLLTPFAADAQDEKTAAFVKAYQEAYGDTPNQFAADGYDAVYIAKAAIEKAGCTPDMKAADMCERLMAAMTEISYTGLTGSDMRWNAAGEVSKQPFAVVIRGGVYVSA